MYYPKQIPYLLNKSFQENIKYEEYQLEELSDYCMCIWTIHSKRALNKTIYNYILPDACIDIVIDFSNKTIHFAGFSKDTVAFKLNKKIDFIGVRLKPSAFYIIFGINADKIMDSPIPFTEIDNQSNLEKIFTLVNIHERINILKKYLLEKIKYKSSLEFIQLVELLYETPTEQKVINIAQKCGYKERHLYRIFKMNYGVSPKVLLNILRLHLCLTLMIEKDMNLIDIASICGFYDQAHFIKEIKRYTGFSPLQLLEQHK